MPVVNTGSVDRDAVVALVAAIVRGIPSLPGAACIGHHDLFDELPGRGHQHHDDEHARIARAAACCGTYPARVQCPTVTTSTTITVAVGCAASAARVRGSNVLRTLGERFDW